MLPVESGGFNVGDTNRNGKLDVPESWSYTCTRAVQTSRRAAATTALNIVNTVGVAGTDPAGTTVTATDTDDVDVFFPKIALTKLVDGQPQVTIPSGGDVTYTYAATNIGDTPLGTVTLTDDTAPCASPTPDPANTPPPLLPGQTWNYSCPSPDVTANVINTATVTGVPLNPANLNQPFPPPNPVVTATDSAEVDVVDPGIDLTKTADPEIVVLDETGAAQPVTYTYEATNNGDVPLNRPGAYPDGPGPTAPGWIDDDTCTPVTYVSGDDGNALLDPGETWQFTCLGAVDEPTLNTADDHRPAVEPRRLAAPRAARELGGPGLRRRAAGRASPSPRRRSSPVVLDPDATPILGPDVPTPRARPSTSTR